MKQPDTATEAWRGGRSEWVYGTDGATETLRDAFDTPQSLWVKAVRRESRGRLLRLILIALAMGITAYVLLGCQANAQTTPPSPAPQPFPTFNSDEYEAMVGIALSCRLGSPVQPKIALEEYLLNSYGEVHDKTAYLRPDTLVELYVNRKTGSWTIIRTGPQKQACLAVAGVHSFGPEEMGL